MTTTTHMPLKKNLSFVAGEAAAELNDAIQRKQTDFAYLKQLNVLLSEKHLFRRDQEAPKLGLVLKGSLDEPLGGFFNVDPSILAVMRDATDKTYGNQLDSSEELRDRINDLEDKFREGLSQVEPSDEVLSALRDFCSALAEYSLSLRQNPYSRESRKPHRRTYGC